MARLRMEVEGTERVAELMEEIQRKTVELQELARELMAAAGGLTLSGTLEPSGDSEVTPETSP